MGMGMKTCAGGDGLAAVGGVMLWPLVWACKRAGDKTPAAQSRSAVASRLMTRLYFQEDAADVLRPMAKGVAKREMLAVAKRKSEMLAVAKREMLAVAKERDAGCGEESGMLAWRWALLRCTGCIIDQVALCGREYSQGSEYSQGGGWYTVGMVCEFWKDRVCGVCRFRV
jgi:hypothetical protein